MPFIERNFVKNFLTWKKLDNIIKDCDEKDFEVILENANLDWPDMLQPGEGIDVVTGKKVNMLKAGIIDPVLVTKSALKNAVSIAKTVMSADCIISNMRTNESS